MMAMVDDDEMAHYDEYYCRWLQLEARRLKCFKFIPEVYCQNRFENKFLRHPLVVLYFVVWALWTWLLVSVAGKEPVWELILVPVLGIVALAPPVCLIYLTLETLFVIAYNLILNKKIARLSKNKEAFFEMPEEPIQVVQDNPSPFFSFYNVGPEMLTYFYPVDADVYKQITESSGLIGPEKYKPFAGAIDAMKENDNAWFCDDEHEEARRLLEKDLLQLAKRHGVVGAYSVLASISPFSKDMERYREKGIEMGCPKCMVGNAASLYTAGRTQDGFALLKRGADCGEKLGCFMVAVSYQYGTLCEMDINRACQYYFKALGAETDFFIYLNLGCILVESGYCHTAIRYFEKMQQAAIKAADDLKEYGSIDRMLQNLDTCRNLVKMNYAERTKRVMVQGHARRLDSIFCKDNKSPEPFVPEHIPYSVDGFVPSDQLFEIDEEDIKERGAEALPAKRPVNKAEDFLFLTIPIKINNTKIQGTQREVLFLEKCCHAELNNYIAKNLVPLRCMFKSAGFIFTYLPSHLNTLEDVHDRIGSYYNDYGRLMANEGWNGNYLAEKRAQEYWEAMVPCEKMPDDCAGFLLYKPNLDDVEDHTNYEYILFPYRMGTDWPRAFREFFALLRGKSIVTVHEREKMVPQLPSGSYLYVSSNYELSLRDNCHSVLAEIKMPTLSRVLYLVLLNHPEGIVIKNMVDYKDELWKYYQAIAGSKAKMENIDMLCDPTNNSINEKLSRIRSAITTAMKSKYTDDMQRFMPTGKRGEAIVVSTDRVKYESIV